MKKLFTFAAIAMTSLAFSQTQVQLVNSDASQSAAEAALTSNLNTVANQFQANGEFLVKFSLNGNKISNFQMHPQTEKSFEVEVKRAIARSYKKHVGTDDNLAMKIAFSQNPKEASDARTNLSAGDPFRAAAGAK